MKIGPVIAMVLALLLIPSIAFAQHTVSFSYQASATVGVSSYNLYRAPCTGTVTANVCSAEGTFAKIGAVAAPALAITDTTPAAGGKYSYYVTAQCPAAGCSSSVTGESDPGNHVGVVIPSDKPLPPGNLAITNVARNLLSNGNTSIVASWSTSPNMQSSYTIYGNGKVLAAGSYKNASGNYTATWTGSVKIGAAISLEVCTQAGECSSKLI